MLCLIFWINGCGWLLYLVVVCVIMMCLLWFAVCFVWGVLWFSYFDLLTVIVLFWLGFIVVCGVIVGCGFGLDYGLFVAVFVYLFTWWVVDLGLVCGYGCLGGFAISLWCLFMFCYISFAFCCLFEFWLVVIWCLVVLLINDTFVMVVCVELVLVVYV